MPRPGETRKRHSRSRSPHRERAHRPRSPKRDSTDRSHKHQSHRSHRSTHRVTKDANKTTKSLPFEASALAKEHYDQYEPLFAQYLDLQKQIDLAALPSAEVKGRWKSFVKKWNRCELAEGWYDPQMLIKAIDDPEWTTPSQNRHVDDAQQDRREQDQGESSSEDDGPGPNLDNPAVARRSAQSRSGPSYPSMQDLELKREQEADDARQVRSELRLERRANQTQEKERLDELAPKAMAGTKERQMEKKRERASANQSFADAKTDGHMTEVADSELMGGEGEGIEAYKKKAKDMERQKNEREIRREEIQRAKQEERQQRVREIQEKEDRTMQGLLELAKQRFG